MGQTKLEFDVQRNVSGSDRKSFHALDIYNPSVTVLPSPRPNINLESSSTYAARSPPQISLYTTPC